MPRTNSRAIQKIEKSQKVLHKNRRHMQIGPAMALTNDLIAALKSGKESSVTIDGEEIFFSPEDIRISGTTKIFISGKEIQLTHVDQDENKQYVMITYCSDDYDDIPAETKILKAA